MLALDEWIFLVSNLRMVSESTKAKMQRYVAVSLSCEKNPAGGCEEFCQDFNINKKSDIFEGEPSFFNEFHKNF